MQQLKGISVRRALALVSLVYASLALTSTAVRAEQPSWERSVTADDPAAEHAHGLTSYSNYLYTVVTNKQGEPFECPGCELVQFTHKGERNWSVPFALSSGVDTNEIYPARLANLAVNQHGVYIISKGATRNYWILAYSHAGDLRWERGVDGTLSAIAADENGVYLTYRTQTFSNYETTLMGLDSNGQEQWQYILEEAPDNNLISNLVVADDVIAAVNPNNFKIHLLQTDGAYVRDLTTLGVVKDIQWFNGALYTHESGAGQMWQKAVATSDAWSYIVSGEDYHRIVRYQQSGATSVLVQTEPQDFDFPLIPISAENNLSVSLRGIELFYQPLLPNGSIHYENYDLDGTLKYSSELASFKSPLSTEYKPQVAITENDTFLMYGLKEFSAGQDSYRLAKLSDAIVGQWKNYSVVSLGDINADGNADYAVSSITYDRWLGEEWVSAQVVYGGSGQLGTTVSLDIIKNPAPLKAINDLNGNGSPELAAFDKFTGGVQIVDSETNAPINFLSFRSQLTPKGWALIPDQNGNGSPEIAVLSRGENRTFAEVKDSYNGELITSVSFNPTFEPMDLSLVADANADGKPELAMLGFNPAAGVTKVEIRGLNGRLVKNIWAGKNYQPLYFADQSAGEELQPLALNHLVFLQEKLVGTGKRSVTVDVAAGIISNVQGLNWQFDLTSAVVLGDITGDGLPEIAALARKRGLVNGKIETKNKVEILDPYAGRVVTRVWQKLNADVYHVAPVVSAGGPIEFATVFRKNGRLFLRVQNAITKQETALISLQ